MVANHLSHSNGKGLPTLWGPLNTVRTWMGTDTRENYVARGGHPIYGESDIEYKFNGSGYRCPEFSETAPIRVISVGCSYVMGLGLPTKDLFHEIFADKLREATNEEVMHWNIGVAGASNELISRLLYQAVPLLDPHVVLVNFTHLSRREYLSVQRRWMPYMPGYEPEPTDAVAWDIQRHFDALISPFDDELNLFRSFKGVETLLRDRFWLFSAINDGGDPIERIREHVDHKLYVGLLDTLDFARDLEHPGPKSQAALALRYWDRFVALKGVERVSAHSRDVPEACG